MEGSAAVAEAAPIIITSLPSVAALHTVVLGPQGLTAAQVQGRTPATRQLLETLGPAAVDGTRELSLEGEF